MKNQNIYVAFDFSKEAESALELAVQFVKQGHNETLVVHTVVEEHDANENEKTLLEEELHKILARYRHPINKLRYEVSAGKPADAVEAYIAELKPLFAFIGDSEKGRINQLLGGSVWRKMLAYTNGSVVVVPKAFVNPKIVRAYVDFDKNTDDVLDAAVDVAQRFNASLEVFHGTFPAILQSGFQLIAGTDLLRDEDNKGLQELVSTLPSNIDVTTMSFSIASKSDLADYIANDTHADFVVMGAEERPFLIQFFDKSLSMQAARHPINPIMLVGKKS